MLSFLLLFSHLFVCLFVVVVVVFLCCYFVNQLEAGNKNRKGGGKKWKDCWSKLKGAVMLQLLKLWCFCFLFSDVCICVSSKTLSQWGGGFSQFWPQFLGAIWVQKVGSISGPQ